MCGIAGIISVNASGMDGIPTSLRRMTAALAHRGPDGEAFWVSGQRHAGLGHRRLKIVDLSDAAAQPMHYLDRYTITYNGEIYNFPELKAALITKNYRFRTSSDTEVMLAAFDCWGKDCVVHFEGMFAFAIWDEKMQSLFCARDRFGEKPFYFFRDENRFLFASEMKALWAAGIEKKIEPAQLLNYISLGLVQDVTRPELTFFEKIFTLPPAHTLTLQLSPFGLQMETYWDLDKESTDLQITDTAAEEKLFGLLQKSVRQRLRSDVSVGSSLSGGLDSSSILYLMSENADPSKLQTFSAVFPGFQQDESNYIREVSEKFNVRNSTVTPDASQWLNDFDRLMYHQEEPFQSSSIYAQYKVYELAKLHSTAVILDGQGADETFAGYPKYLPWYWQELYRKNASKAQQERIAAADLGVPVSWGAKNKIAAYWPAMAAAALGRKAFRQQSKAFLETEFLRAYADRQTVSKPVVRKLNDLLYFHLRHLGLQELLRYADRNSMAHGREVRLPFLNHELVQFAFSLPASFKIRNGWTKWVLRKSMDMRLPEKIVWRKDKIGFEPPQRAWLAEKKIQEKIMGSRQTLVSASILKREVMALPIRAEDAHAAGNQDFRILCAAALVENKTY